MLYSYLPPPPTCPFTCSTREEYCTYIYQPIQVSHKYLCFMQIIYSFAENMILSFLEYININTNSYLLYSPAYPYPYHNIPYHTLAADAHPS